jgi:hypothetical protein
LEKASGTAGEDNKFFDDIDLFSIISKLSLGNEGEMICTMVLWSSDDSMVIAAACSQMASIRY